MNAVTGPTNHDGRSSQTWMCLSSLPRSRSECPSVPGAVTFARTFEAAGSHGERPDVANDPDANRSDVFVLRPYNGLALSRERRLNNPAILPDATAPIAGCSAVLDGPSNEPAPNHNARECHDGSNNPQSGATATDRWT